ncbi:MAG TPA: endonuclease III domain-containing protein [Nitrospiria bacterium]
MSPSRLNLSGRKVPCGNTLNQFYEALFQAYGPQRWWPGETPFEVIVGAILTQNTAWSNVEKAIRNLRAASVLTPRKLHGVPLDRLAGLIRPSGYYNVKARRIRAFTDTLFDAFDGSLAKMFRGDAAELRDRLLAVKGIGPETADSILLYAGEKPFFVIDLYTRRVLARHGLADYKAPYEVLQGVFTDYLPVRATLFNEYHALIVRVGKEHCGPRPSCRGCPLEPFLNGKNPENLDV